MINFKIKAENSEKFIGTMLSELYSPNIPMLFKACGFDYFIVDCEHGCFDYSMIAVMAAVSKSAGIPMIVRIPLISRECILKYMDMGVSGLLIPMVSNVEDVVKTIEYSKYAPLGRRGITTTRAHTAYSVGDLKAYMETANKETVILAQIESNIGMKNIESIVKTEGLDGIIVGPNDLSQDMGVAGKLDNIMLKDAIRNIGRHALASGKFSGIITSNIGLLNECKDMGMKLLCWNSELGMIMKSAANGIKELGIG